MATVSQDCVSGRPLLMPPLHLTPVRRHRATTDSQMCSMEELRVLDELRKLLELEHLASLPEPKAKMSGASAASGRNGVDEEEGMASDNDSLSKDEGEASNPVGRRGRPSKRKREPELKPTQRSVKAGKISKTIDHLHNVLRDIEKKKAQIRDCEMETAKAEEDLRELDTARTRCLGKDRFWNRYWFLERNAMPWGGLHYCSTGDSEYANGCIWVQGPDELERTAFIDVTDEEEQRYRALFKMTPRERKESEEGLTSVFDARQWGYYDEPDSLDMLIGWLDVRGHRELKLRKELQSIRGRIIKHMEKRKIYLANAPVENKTSDKPTRRVSTRTQNHTDPAQYRCQRWHNTMVLAELGHLHSEQPPRRGRAKGSRTRNPRGGS